MEAVSFGSSSSQFSDRKREAALSDHVRQMAVSQTLLRHSHAASFLVMIGRDHRVVVLEDCSGCDAEGLPRAFEWLKSPLDYWFRSGQPFAAFLREFVAAVGPYSRKSAERKQQWDNNNDSDFSEWNFLATMLAPSVARLGDAQSHAAAEFASRRLP